MKAIHEDPQIRIITLYSEYNVIDNLNSKRIKIHSCNFDYK